jgi:hypothetical protein
VSDAFSYQCWICPYCYDDHKRDGDCKQEDLKGEIDKLRDIIGEIPKDTGV